jgi:fatty acid desaturase
VIYGLWLAATAEWRAIPVWLLPFVGGWIVAWHMSLQHELLHGHPTPWSRVNTLMGAFSLSLWLPFECYRYTHLQHHVDSRLTDPLDDPESNYWTPEQWAALGAVGRFATVAQATLLGRIVVGPAVAIWRYGQWKFAQVRGGDRDAIAMLLRHCVAIAPLVVWIVAVCGMPFWVYALAFIYPGTALSRIRSFAEHRAEETVGRRTAIVERSFILGPLFLFNNLHQAHHVRATMPWYRLPGWYRAHREALVARSGGLVYDSYFDVARRYLFHPHDRLVHPGDGGRAP